MNRKLFLFGFITLILFLLSYKYSLAAGPWKGKIVDTETREPLEGAVVVAVWERVYRTPYGTNSYFYEAKETLTDREGRFEIPSYTPINLLPIISYIKEPEFTIFKPGYGSLRMALGKYLTGKKGIESYSAKLSGYMIKVSPSIIELQRLKTKEERLKVLPSGLMYEEAEKKAKNYMKCLNIERIGLGLDPIPEKGDSK